MYAQRRDTAEPPILEYLNSIGARYQQMDKSAGFDLLVFYRGQIYVIEIKTVTKPKTRAQLEAMLTGNERRTMELIQSAGCRYHIVTCPAEMAGVLEHSYSPPLAQVGDAGIMIMNQ